jgi:suppressor for copper-sensitivity B
MKRIFIFAVAGLLGALLAAANATLPAQDAPPAGKEKPREEVPFNVFNDLGGLGELGGFGGAAGKEITLSAQFKVEKGGRDGMLSVRAELAPNWHVYSITQPDDGPMRTQIKVPSAGAGQFEITGAFEPDQEPIIHPPKVFTVPSEEHSGKVTWTAPIRLAEGVDPSQLTIQVAFNGQVCEEEGVCIPINKPSLSAKFAGYYEVGLPTGEYRAENTHVIIRGHVEPQVAAPGDKVKVVLTAVPDPKWHVYARADRDPNKVAKPTLIVLTKLSGWSASAPQASAEPIEKESGIPEEPVLRYHEEPVTWTTEIQVAKNAVPGQYTLAGLIGYQACHRTCDSPTAAQFTAKIDVGSARVEGQVPLTFVAAEYDDVAVAAAARASVANRSAASEFDHLPLAAILGLAFVAGLILNVMPCVLPVIGLKIMSFVQQSGQSRLRILALNMWFSLGLLAVFWAFATVAVLLTMLGRESLGWGGQFAYPPFIITLSAIVFVFALSFLGVWEVPIPGFVGSDSASKIASKEGATGAFSKGILATLLATPCTGPFLGPAVTWAIAQPPWLTYTAFSFIGLGMASPYLLIGAFPRLIGMLPKPGAWMETFKQLMGFVLLATVVWLFDSLDQAYAVKTLALLLALGFACWFVGRVPLTAELGDKLRAWAGALAVVVMVAAVAFVKNRYVIPSVSLTVGVGLGGWLIARTPLSAALNQKIAGWGGGAVLAGLGGFIAYLALLSAELPWEPFTRATLDQYRQQGHTVLVDFTADW